MSEMKKMYDGGQAFPCEGGVDSGLHPDPGMSLRDWFAGQALAGLLANPEMTTVFSINEMWRHAYGAADEMLAARSATPSNDKETGTP